MPVPPLRILLSLLAVLALSALLAAPTAHAQAQAPDDPSIVPPPSQRLDQGWEFRLDAANVGAKAGWKNGAWHEDWSDVTVPHVFNPNPIKAEFEGTIGWYRMRLITPATPAGFGWAMRFNGVRRISHVWLNGSKLGRNTNPYEPFRYSLPNLAPPGQPNTLVVRVQNIRPATLREGWWNWGGITRPVELEPVGRAMWRDLGVLSDVDCEPGAASCTPLARTDGRLYNHTRETIRPTLTLRLTSPRGEVTSRSITSEPIKPFGVRRVGFRVALKGAPALWSPKNPQLYRAQIEVKLGDDVTQYEERRVGFRFVRVQNGALYLNGHRLQLRGASIQEDLPGRGPALRDEDIETIIGDLKALGANITRAQYPLDERILTRLDEEGILVWSQAPVYHADEELKTRAGRSAHLDKVRHTVLYARNHPSVMTHSVANELSPYADSMPGTRRFLVRAWEVARDLDNTVPAALDLLSYPNIPRQRSYSGYGLLGINSYYGWYDGKAGAQSTARFSDLEPFLRSMKRKYPRQAQMITEFGAEATFKGPKHVKETFAFQSRYVDRTLNVVEKLRWLSGAIYWTAREFHVKPDWDGGARRRNVRRDSLHNKGLIRYDGKPKPAFYRAKRAFQSTPVYREP
jgi:beta-glucuronidase